MAYSEITNAEIDTDSPITQTLMTKFRDNPIIALAGEALYNGSSWHPVDWTSSDQTGDGLIYDNAVDGDVASVTYALEDGWDYLLVLDGIGHDSALNDESIQVQDSSDGSTFSTIGSSNSFPSANVLNACVSLITPRNSTVTAPGVCNFISGNNSFDRLLTYEITHSIRFTISGGDSIDAGKIYAFRRREYASGL